MLWWWKNNISFKKDTEIEKVVLLQVKDLIQLIVKFGLKKFCARFSSTEHPFEGYTKYHAQKRLCSNIYILLKEWLESLYFPEGK